MAGESRVEQADRPQEGRRYFTIEEANRALPYVSRIAEDIRSAYRDAVRVQREIDQCSPDDDSAHRLRAHYEAIVDKLNNFVGELHDVGVELKDYDQGLLDFPSLHEGREVYLCWRRGEEQIVAWHEINDGYAGRQDVAQLKPGAPAG